MLLAILLAVSAPSPQPLPTLAPLKEIGRVRTTPLCSTLQKMGPAVGHLLSNDAEIDASIPTYANMYVDDVIFRSRGWMDIDMLHMENRIGPIVNNLAKIENEMSAEHIGSGAAQDPRFIDMRKELEAAVEEQKAALNVISGFVATYQMGSIQNSSLDNPSAERVFFAQRGGQVSTGGTVPFGVNALYSAGLSGGIRRMPMFDPALASLGHDPYLPFAEEIVARRKTESVIETNLARLLEAVVRTCRSD